jgi:DNA helicase HerA-like ATPase
VKDSGSEIGYIVGENTSDYLTFVAPSDIPLKKWDFVYVFIEEKEFLGRIEKVLSRSELLNEDLGYESTRKYVSRGMFDELLLCRARLLGSLVNNEIVTPRNIIKPGTVVYRTSETSLKEFFGFPEDRALLIGNLIDHDDVPVSIDVSGLRRHLAILAQTGAGKSNVAAVIMEELLEKGASIIVLDPHADYVFMKKGTNGKMYSDGISVFRTPLSTGRYTNNDVGIINNFTIRFSDLSPDDVKGIMDIREGYTNLISIVDDIYKKMKGRKDLNDFLETAKSLSPEDYKKIRGRLTFLKKIKDIFQDYTTGINDYLGPGKMSVMDLSGMDQFLANYFSYRVLSSIYDVKLSSEFKYPVFVFIEEAHNFVPPRTNSNIAKMIKKIAGEGRKFGIFLVVITQRPGKIDADVLSQCNSQIILRVTNPSDQNAILESSENITGYLMNDLPSLDTGEAIIVGEIVKMPAIVKIRDRETMAGGSDIDVIALLKEAREEVRKKNDPSEVRKKAKDLLGEF